jgi:hypothetical protein
MTNMFFQCLKVDIFSISYQQAVVVEHWDFSKHWDFQSKDVVSDKKALALLRYVYCICI